MRIPILDYHVSRLEDALVVLNCLATVTRGRNEDMGATGEESLDDCDSNQTFNNTSEKGILVFEGGAQHRDLVENVEIDGGEIARVFPSPSRLAREKEQGNLIVGQCRGYDHLWAQDLRRGAVSVGCNAASSHHRALTGERANHVIIRGP